MIVPNNHSCKYSLRILPYIRCVRPGVRIGFVSPRPPACSIRHNHFATKHLPVVSLRRDWLCLAHSTSGGPGRSNLGLFRTMGHAPELALFVQPVPPAELALFRTIGSQPYSAIRNRDIGFVSHDRPAVASYFQHQTSHFQHLLFIRVPLIPAVLQESARKNGWRRPPKSL